MHKSFLARYKDIKKTDGLNGSVSMYTKQVILNMDTEIVWKGLWGMYTN